MVKSLLQQIKAKAKKIPFIPFRQDGKTYNMYDMPDGFVIKGDLNLSYKNLTELPDLSKVIVKGDFDCQNNELTSLKGTPQEVGGDFDCSHNNLTSLEGAPQEVGGDFDCHWNNLPSLQGAPQEVGGNFYCYNNQLASLQGAPREVGGDFMCQNNELTSLQGAPQAVGGEFGCHNNHLTSLQGAPKEIGGDFCFKGNDDLSSLFGLSKMPKDKEIYCDDALEEKYDCPKSQNNGIYYKDLLKSSAYQSEISINRFLAKINNRNKAEKDNKRRQKLKAGFAAFRKKQAEEREE